MNGTHGINALTRNETATGILKIMIAVAVVIPTVLLAYATHSSYQSLARLVDERAERTLDVMQEHTLKVFQTAERILFEAADLIQSSEQTQENALHGRFAKLRTAVPKMEAIWAFDSRGRPLASSTVYPVPKDLDNSDRDYFLAQKQSGPSNVYIGANVSAKVGGSIFFVFSRRLTDPSGAFGGVVAVAMPPDGLNSFYEKLVGRSGFAAALIKETGSVLARYPEPSKGLINARVSSRFLDAVQQSETGRYETVSGLDGTQRSVRYRKVPGYPLYVVAAFEQRIFWQDFLLQLAWDFAVGLPAAILLVVIGWIALRRTRLLCEEFDRRQQAEAALKQAQRLEALGRLTGGVAHDFNNLLMVIQGNAQRVLRLAQDPKLERAISAILEATRRGSGLTRQLLTFSRRQTVQPEVIDMAEQLPAFREMLQASLRGDIKTILEIQTDIWRVEVDLAELELAFLNLGVNARDAMPAGGTLRISVENSRVRDSDDLGINGEFVVLRVSDSGIGMTADVVPSIFEPFFTTKPGGTGLGLSQVYGFVKQAGGTVTVESSEGNGTCFTLYLPRTEKRTSACPMPAAVAEPSRPMQILLVEDNEEILEVTAANLESLGHTVLRARTGTDAFELVKSRPEIELVFSDIVMPGRMSGIDLAKAVAKQRPEVRVVLATGYSIGARSAALEGIIILSKPYDLHALQRALCGAGGSLT